MPRSGGALISVLDDIPTNGQYGRLTRLPTSPPPAVATTAPLGRTWNASDLKQTKLAGRTEHCAMRRPPRTRTPRDGFRCEGRPSDAAPATFGRLARPLEEHARSRSVRSPRLTAPGARTQRRVAAGKQCARRFALVLEHGSILNFCPRRIWPVATCSASSCYVECPFRGSLERIVAAGRAARPIQPASERRARRFLRRFSMTRR